MASNVPEQMNQALTEFIEVLIENNRISTVPLAPKTIEITPADINEFINLCVERSTEQSGSDE